ncbi:cysteine desulfurase family protein [Chryseobacterium sp. SC28]|uniref:cysteine desulfurase family protein n=1 Tax=Chryseobacterium sp. SC28 TaxID=2268028 RepID=UPI000F64BDE6|nr:cysteine desulfurase family protein [Chryseobacterium sp. SC28]RRQ46075.1 cysteine desulfurase [Chryseobacterium sp. SC28]
MNEFVYLDYNATTPVDERVVQAMLPYFQKFYANPGSAHLFGLAVKESLEQATAIMADYISAKSDEIIYTSGATEAVNLAIKGVTTSEDKSHIITVKTEHKAVLDACLHAERHENITYLNVRKDGLIDADELRNTINDETFLVCIMLVNNETGVIQPVQEIAKIAHQKGCLVFCDATQAVGKIPVNVKSLGIDLMAFSAHKFYGPKGIGGLYISSDIKHKMHAQIHGGGQQFNLRSGTLNVPGIIGMAKASEIALAEKNLNKQILELRNQLENELLDIADTKINGNIQHRIFNTSNICFAGVNAEQMILSLGEICVSSGSACNATTSRPSHVLKAMGMDDLDALSSIRFSLGKFTTPEEIELAVKKIKQTVTRLREN